MSRDGTVHCELDRSHVITHTACSARPGLVSPKGNSSRDLLFSALAFNNASAHSLLFVRHTKAQTRRHNDCAVPLLFFSKCSAGTGSLSLFTSIYLTTH